MAWTLQPRSYMQAIRPNLYNIAYRRTGAYKGMGSLGQEPPDLSAACPGTPGCPGYVDPYQNLSTLTEGVLSGQNVIVSADAYSQMLKAGLTQPATISTLTKWMPWILGGVLVVVFLGIGGRRR